jgi:hypothetical protein
MAFELLFFNEPSKEVNTDEVIDYFEQLPNFTVSKYKENHHFTYLNENTYVYFTIRKIENTKSLESIQTNDLTFSGLTFAINLIRCDFFAYEAMPIVSQFIKKFGLFIYDPQKQEENNIPRIYSTDELIASWIHSNKTVTIEFNDKASINTIKKEKASYIYNYAKQLDHFIEQSQDEYVVPQIFVGQDQNTYETYTLLKWEDSLPTLVPQVDYILITHTEKKLFGLVSKQHGCLLDYPTFKQTFKSVLKEYTCELNIDIISDDDQAETIINLLPKNPVPNLTTLTYDDFVDLDLTK